MVFGVKKLQNDIFCLTEERDFFQGKYLEQVSELSALKDELKKSKREIAKLRNELMESSRMSLHIDTGIAGEGGEEEDEDDDEEQVDGDLPPGVPSRDDNSTLSSHGEEEDDDEDVEENPQVMSPRFKIPDEEEDQEAKEIRQSAEKLLQWASYRSSVTTSRTVGSTPDQLSVASPSSYGQAHHLEIPRTIQSSSFVEDKEEEPESDVEDNEEEVDQEPSTRGQRLMHKFEQVVTSL